ncbi:MAG: GNAT family N-acetyltransferase [Desulfobacter sp.]|nr:MAG: GNAT family N-acetyltransferase [Desulfobacter sp.]
MKKIKLKSVDSEAAGIIVNIHFDAVHKGFASHFYDKEILNDWSPPISEERIGDFKRRISETQPIAILAYLDEEPVGFGIFDKELQRIGAIYVKAAYTGFYVGTTLLKELERIAIQNSCEQLHLESSLNAKEFYEKQGFESISEGFFSLPSGQQMKSVNMSKMLTKGSGRPGGLSPF